MNSHKMLDGTKKHIKTHKNLIFITIIISILLVVCCILLIQKHYSLFISFITAVGTLVLAFAAFQQIRQSEKFRKDEKREKQKDFDNKKKAIYSIVISKINYNVGTIPNLSFFSDTQNKQNNLTNPFNVPHSFSDISALDALYNDKTILNMLKINREYYSLLKTEAIYFTINAVDAINGSSYALDALIIAINNMQNGKNTSIKPDFSDPLYFNLCDKYYTAIIDSIKCISILIEEGNLKSDIHKNFVQSQIESLNNIEKKIRDNDEKIKNTKSVKIINDNTKELDEIESLRKTFSNYLSS